MQYGARPDYCCVATIGLLVHSQCVGIIFSSECSAQMGPEQAGDYSSSSRNNASSTIEGKGDTMTLGIAFTVKRCVSAKKP